VTRGTLCTPVIFTILLACATSAGAQSPSVLYTWEGTGDTRVWAKNFGDNEVTLENSVAGELTITETGTEGAGVAVSDGGNIVSEDAPAGSQGGLDLTGLSSLEFDVGHDGAEPIQVQFFIQGSPAFNFVALGPDQAVAPGMATYSLPLNDLTAEQIAHIRVIGLNIREHIDQGNVVWTIREVRSAGTRLPERTFASHDPDAPEGGLQGAYVNFHNAAVQGNDGGQNQTGLSHNGAEPPAGNTGSLRWTDVAGGGGGAITWGNGTAFAGNSFGERPTDMSNYTSIVVRMAATNVTEGAVESVTVSYFLQTGGFNFQPAGSGQTLPADGEFHELSFPITSITRLDLVDAHGLDLQEHSGGDLLMDIDFIRAIGSEPFPDCNGNSVPDARDLAEGTSEDCNFNALPDECDIDEGRSDDCNRNNVPDECEVGGDDRTRVLYTWNTLGDPVGWDKRFGANALEVAVETAGELTLREVGDSGTDVAFSDSFNLGAEGGGNHGGLDLTGATELEFEMGHSGAGNVNVQFYVQATPASTYVALGPDQAIEPGMKVYTAPLGALTPEQLTYLRTIGINARPHQAEGNLEWTIREIRSKGAHLGQRVYADHEPGSSDMGLQGAIVADANAAVEGNDGGDNQTGLRHNVTTSPPGNTGSLQWTDLLGQGGAQVAWFNGTVFGGDTFGERPTDMSSYTEIVVRMAATNVEPDAVESVDVQYLLLTENFTFHAAGPAQALPADGAFHELTFPIADIPGREYTDAHGIDLGDHPEGSLVIDVDRITAVRQVSSEGDCNANGIPDACDIEDGTSMDTNMDGVPDECAPGGDLFRRGDSNNDERLDISDALYTLNYLFLGGEDLACLESGNTNGDDSVDIGDPVYFLNHLFLGGPAPPPPFPDCGAVEGVECPESSCNT